MTLITFQNGKVVMRDGKVGTEQECCCGGCDCSDVALDVFGNMSGTIDITIEGQTFSSDDVIVIGFTTYDVDNGFLLCFANGIPGQKFIGRRLTGGFRPYCNNGKVEAIVRVTGFFSGGGDPCNAQKVYTYRFDNCASDGLPTGEATLISTVDQGETGGDCDSPFLNRDCLNDLGPPTSVTYNPLP